mmetsp:Transcript_34554/g.82472  ORF Transcript_34554/g.82472 Transcript_34554/m.82472 type:complete len:162 (-) Transcript_34554:407-892(-)
MPRWRLHNSLLRVQHTAARPNSGEVMARSVPPARPVHQCAGLLTHALAFQPLGQTLAGYASGLGHVLSVFHGGLRLAAAPAASAASVAAAAVAAAVTATAGAAAAAAAAEAAAAAGAATVTATAGAAAVAAASAEAVSVSTEELLLEWRLWAQPLGVVCWT